jgi:ATP-dependent Zn protease
VQYEGSSLSPGTRAIVEEEVQALVQQAYARAKSLIQANEGKLHELAKALVERETLSGDQISELLGLPTRKI